MNFHNHLNQFVETVIFIPCSMDRCPSRLRPYLKGEGINEKSKTWLPPPLVLVLGEVNIAMVDAAILAQRRFLSKTKDLHIS